MNVFRRVNMTAEQGLAWAALAVVMFALYLDIAVRIDPISVDFHTYLAAAQVGLQHGWSRIYDQGLVAAQQNVLMPAGRSQPFISPPAVAFLVAPLAWMPYDAAYTVWAFVTFAAFGLAMAFSGVTTGLGRWIGVVGALTPWWVIHAINVGQVVPLIAAGLVVGWRLLRDRRDILAGIALSAIMLKPNTALLVPIALLFATRFKALASWAVTSAAVSLALLVAIGPSGIESYITQLRGSWPTGADNLTLHGALGLTGLSAAAARIVIVGAVIGGAFRFRGTPGMVVPLAAIGSLLVAPYLHASDLCVLSAAAWMLWEERPAPAWRALLAAGWLIASPFLFLLQAGPRLSQWPLLEMVLFLAVCAVAIGPLTARADSRRRAPA